MLRKIGQCAGGPRIEDAEILVVDFYAELLISLSEQDNALAGIMPWWNDLHGGKDRVI